VRRRGRASIDGLRFVIPRRTIHAGYNRRYFQRRRGVTALGTTADHYAGLRTIVIPGTSTTATTSGSGGASSSSSTAAKAATASPATSATAAAASCASPTAKAKKNNSARSA
jgi:hypothetical protein